MPFINLSEFYRLSSALNYNLTATSASRYSILMFLINGKRLHENPKIDREQKGIVMEALSFIFDAYSRKRRDLGSMAVLHPLRAVAILARAMDGMELLHVLTILFHDVLEDVKPTNFGQKEWRHLEEQMLSLMEKLDPEIEKRLTHRLDYLTKRPHESYYSYIGRILSFPGNTAELLQAKLADRLDNTLDMRIELNDPLENIDFFQNVFQLLFLSNVGIPGSSAPISPTAAMNVAQRLYQLFKNTVLLSLVRMHPVPYQPSLHTLFNAICEASLREAQRNFIQLAESRFNDTEKLRMLVLEAMEYCRSGGSHLVTSPDSGRSMDGIFTTYFGSPDKKERLRKLDEFFGKKDLMLQAVIAFIVIFLSFLNDDTFFVKGIGPDGIHPG